MKKVFSIVLAFCLCFSLVGCSPQNTSPIAKEEINDLYTSPDSFKGRTFEFAGKVFNIESSGETLTLQVWYDVKNLDKNTIVHYSGENANVKENDYISVKGVVEGQFKGENAFGGEITAPVIKAETLELSDYASIIDPAKKTIKLDKKSQKQKGYSVTIDKIELTDNETRVYVTVNNKGKSKFSLYSFNAKLVQDGKQLSEESNFEADYPKIESDLQVGAKTSGIITFPPIKEKDFKLIFEAYSDNWNETIKDYTFKVKTD